MLAPVLVFVKFTDVEGCTWYRRGFDRAPYGCRADREGNIIEVERGISLYPNPSSGLFKVTAHNAAGNETLEVQVFNGLGQMVRKMEIVENTESVLDLTNEAEGMYTVRIVGKSYVSVQKVLLEK